MESIQKNSGLFIAEGVLLIVLGVLAIAMPVLSTLGLGILLGAVLLIGGIVRLFRSISLRDEIQHFWLSLLSGIVAIIIGALFLSNLITGIYLLTIFLAAFFLVDGAASIYFAIVSRQYSGWGWLLFSGILSIILAILIVSGLPAAAFWVPGLLLGINLIVTGFSLTFVAARSGRLAHEYRT